MRDSSSAFSRKSSSTDFSLVFSTRRAFSSAFSCVCCSSSYSYFSSALRLASSTRRPPPPALVRCARWRSSTFRLASSASKASTSASSCACSSFFTLCLASRARKNPYSNFNRERLCSSSLCLASSERCASLSAICLILFLGFQPSFFNDMYLFFSLQPCILILLFLSFQPCLFNEACLLFILYHLVILLFLCSLSRFKG